MGRIRLMCAASAAALMAAGLSAQPAGAAISFDGIGEVKLGMSGDAVRDTLGSPSVSTASDRPGTTRLVYRRHKLEVMVHDGDDEVVAVHTRSRSQKTSSRIRVGSSVATLRRRVSGEHCGSANRVQVCFVEGADAVMEFFHRRGRIFEIGLALKG